jgi:hypothetical protein
MIAPAGALLLGCAYGAGLATGLARFPDPLLVTFAAFAAALWRPRAPIWPAMLALAAGVVVGGAARAHERTACAAVLPLGERRFVVEAIEPGRGSGRVRVRAMRCHGEVVARWPSPSVIPAGAIVTVRARWLARPRARSTPPGVLLLRRV